jgi:hypothetical protein
VQGRETILQSTAATDTEVLLDPAADRRDVLFSPAVHRPRAKSQGARGCLPANRQAGDLLCTSMKNANRPSVAILWFGVTGGDKANPAKWRQVLLGPDVKA